MALQYLGVGLSKTGTSSLGAAMNLLGIRTMHWEPGRLSKVIRGKDNAPHFDIYDDCECMTDIPHAYFYREIGAAYPGLKYMLTERNEDKWFASMCKHYSTVQHDWTAREMEDALETLRIVYGVEHIKDIPKREFLLKKRYRDWNEHIKRSIPSTHLLVMNICDGKNGWNDLCSFVGVNAPAIPFPNENKARRPPPPLRKLKNSGKRLLQSAKNTFND